jgi:uncharacterized protein (TIGR02421 family)
MNKKHLEQLKSIDKSIVDAAKNIKVLTRLSWPAKVKADFLKQWRGGNPQMPVVDYASDDTLQVASLSLGAAEKKLSPFDHPLADFLSKTAQSYQTLCRLLFAVGTPDMLAPSRELYGSPGAPLADGKVNNLQAAAHFVDLSSQYYKALHLQEIDYCLPASIMKTELENRLSEVFPAGLVQVTIDPRLASKAAAGATRIRLREGTCFSEYDLEQLLQHEAFIHSLTALNGRAQENASCLGLSAPRTTGTQEGLATFAELITGAIDIDRMERIALRVIGIDMALRGGDFLDVFRFFLDKNQTEDESFNSTMRIFRGAPLTGGAAFTKDVVYLHGLMEVHTFFRWAMRNQRLELCRYLLAGRMTISDVIALAPLFADGTLKPPQYIPPWMAKTNGLAGYLAFSIFANKITIEGIDEHHRFDRVADLDS